MISRSIIEVSPLALLVTSRHVDKHWLQKSESHRVMSEHGGGARRAAPSSPERDLHHLAKGRLPSTGGTVEHGELDAVVS